MLPLQANQIVVLIKVQSRKYKHTAVMILSLAVSKDLRSEYLKYSNLLHNFE